MPAAAVLKSFKSFVTKFLLHMILQLPANGWLGTEDFEMYVSKKTRLFEEEKLLFPF